MAIRVALVGTGNCGRLSLIQLIQDPRFELVAVGTSTGVTATPGIEGALAAKPECLVYCAMGDTRPVEATRDVMAALSAGVNVVGSAPGGLKFPRGAMPEKAIARV